MTTSDSDRAPEPTSPDVAGPPAPDETGSPAPQAGSPDSADPALPESAAFAPPPPQSPAPAPPAAAQSPEQTPAPAPAPPAPTAESPSAAPAPPPDSPASAGHEAGGTPATRRTRPSWLTTTSPPTSQERDEDLESTAVRRQGLLAPTSTPAEGDASSPTRAEEEPARTAEYPEDRTRADHTPEDAADDSALLDGATHVRPPSRVWAHVITPFITLLLVPVAWYLIADGGARIALAQDSSPGQMAIWPLLEVIAGLLLAAGILLLARWSALGAIIVGALVALVSAPFLLAPGWATDLVAPAMNWLNDLAVFDALGPNIAYHLQADALVGRLTLYGVALLVTGIVVALGRRAGRDDQRAEDAYARSTHRPHS